jgi:hypothetical protein
LGKGQQFPTQPGFAVLQAVRMFVPHAEAAIKPVPEGTPDIGEDEGSEEWNRRGWKRPLKNWSHHQEQEKALDEIPACSGTEAMMQENFKRDGCSDRGALE